MDKLSRESVLARYRRAQERRRPWEGLWREAYDYALPQRDVLREQGNPGIRRGDSLFDGTAPDAVDQLAASLLAQLTPPWARWFGLETGVDLPGAERGQAAQVLEAVATGIQAHFDRSNFAVEIHQCYLDLVTGGTASLLFEEARPGSASAFRFTAVPLGQVVFDEGPDGDIDVTFRRQMLTLEQVRSRFPKAKLPEWLARAADGSTVTDIDARATVLEAVIPDGGGYRYVALLEPDGPADDDSGFLAEGRFAQSPFINFRWLRAPGEIYGRSPVMKTLPDIKTANKVVELVLKNASIAVTGIWQADDDGVLNPATIRLVPGSIIPKAVGSAGLTPLEAPGRFDVSELVLADLRKRIRHALLVDRLGPPENPRMTATEVLERSAEMARILGATYGRLQSELLDPLIVRALAILRRRGEAPDIVIDGRTVDLRYRSPLARNQAREDVANVGLWISSISELGPEAMQAVDPEIAARWIAQRLGVPPEIVREAVPAPDAADPLAALAELLPGGKESLADPAGIAKGLAGLLPAPPEAGDDDGNGDDGADSGTRDGDGPALPASIAGAVTATGGAPGPASGPGDGS